MQPIKIAVVGQANAGKTTLIRTLMKASKGEVGDRAGVTGAVQSYNFEEEEGLQATFIDTPGFQNANVIEMYLDLLNKNPGLKMERKWESQTALEWDALKAVKESEVVVYVASLTEDEARQLEEQICRFQASFSEIKWANANKLSIIEYCEKILKYLEKESE